MKKVILAVSAAILSVSLHAQEIAPPVDTAAAPTMLSLEEALQIALSENVSVKVADMEIQRSQYARRGTYASLFPQIDGNAAFQRTIKKQVMYMDFDMSAMAGAAGGQGAGSGDSGSGSGSGSGAGSGAGSGSAGKAPSGGFEVGRWNTWSAGISASMPLVNAQLWKSLTISDQDVELAVEKARSSRLEMVNQVKQAYFTCMLTKLSFEVFKQVYDNAVANLENTQRKYNAQRASELDLVRAKTNVANAIPNVYDAENSMILSLWQLKAVMGVDLDMNIGVSGNLEDYAENMLDGYADAESLTLENNTTLKQLAIQAEQLANTVKLQQYAYLPSLAVAFSYSYSAMTNDFKFSEYKWTPYSYVGLSLSIPIFSGGKRYNAVKQARVQAAEFQLQRDNTERQLKIAIRQYLNQMESSIKSLGSAEAALETAHKAYDIASRSYEVGRSTLTDLNDAQLALVQTQLSLSQAVYNYLVAKANLENTLGADFTE